MTARPRTLALAIAAIPLASCGGLTVPAEWPAIWPSWQGDARETESAIIAEAPADAGTALPANGAPPDTQTSVEPSDSALLAARLLRESTREAAEASAREQAAARPTEPAVVIAPEPEPTQLAGPAGPTGVRAQAPPFLPPALELAALLDVELSADGGGERLADLELDLDTGRVLAALVAAPAQDGSPREHLIGVEALTWGAGRPPRLAAGLPQTDVRELFAAEDLVQLTGTVNDLEEVDGSAALQILGEGNLLYRVELPAREMIERRLEALAESAGIRVLAAPSRDANGKVWIPASLSVGPETVELRDAQGLPIWSNLRTNSTSARALRGATLSIDEEMWTVAEVLLEPNGRTARELLLRRGEAERVLGWAQAVEAGLASR